MDYVYYAIDAEEGIDGDFISLLELEEPVFFNVHDNIHWVGTPDKKEVRKIMMSSGRMYDKPTFVWYDANGNPKRKWSI